MTDKTEKLSVQCLECKYYDFSECKEGCFVNHDLQPVLDSKALTVVEQGKALEISDKASLAHAVNIAQELKDLKHEYEYLFAPLLQAAQKRLQNLKDKQFKYINPLKTATIDMKEKIETHLDQNENEVKAKIEVAERKLWQEELDKLETYAAENNMLCNLSAGSSVTMQIDKLRAQLDSQPEIEIPKPKVKGLAIRKEYEVEIIDEWTLLNAVLNHFNVPPHIIKWDMQAIKELAKRGMDIPGVKITVTNKSSIRRKTNENL